MELISFAFLALLTILVFLTGKDAIPMLEFILQPDSMRYSFEDSVGGQDLISRSGALQDWICRLKEFGFFLIGVKVEKLPLWGGAYREAALVSPDAEIYASIVLRRDGSPASLYFYTPFRDGGMVFTRNYSGAPEMEGERISVKNMPTQDFQEILDSHEKRLRTFKESGLMPLAGSSPQARIEATRAFYLSEYARRHGQHLASPGILSFGGVLLLLLFVACRIALAPK
jgi:hypothetical protein